MRKASRLVLLSVLRSLGLMKLWQAVHRHEVPILAFHGVANDRNNGAWTPLRPRLPTRDFERYIRLLTRHFRCVPLAHAFESLIGCRPAMTGSIVLTFDDGYRNSATLAWPILRKYGATATFFIPTGHIGTGKAFWVDRLDYALQHLAPGCDFIEIAERRYHVPRDDRQGLLRSFTQVMAACMALGWRAAEGAVGEVEKLASSRLNDVLDEDPWAGFMTWQEVRQMQEDGADFGSHTVNHLLLDELAGEDVQRELTGSKARIESETQRPCDFLAYPAGRVTNIVASLARRSGYRGAVTMAEAPARASSDPMQVPRIGIPKRPVRDTDLLARVNGLSSAISAFLRGKPRCAR